MIEYETEWEEHRRKMKAIQEQIRSNLQREFNDSEELKKVVLDRNCNRCVYSTRNGDCVKWTCDGTVTVNTLKHNAMQELADKLIETWSFIDEDGDTVIAISKECLYKVCEDLKGGR